MSGQTVFVTGATGSIGTNVVRLLAEDDRVGTIRAGTRDAADVISKHLAEVPNQHKIEAVQIEPSDPSPEQAQNLIEAFTGCDALIVIAPLIEQMQQWHERVATAAAAAGVTFVVKSSVTGARSPDSETPPGPLPLGHWLGEQALRDADLTVVAIRPTIFMQHFMTVPALYTRGDDKFYLPSGGGRIAFLDNRDIGRMAVGLVLLSEDQRQPFVGNGYELTGPAALTGAEMAQTLSEAAGRTFRHIDGLAEFSDHAAEVGVLDTVKNVYAEAAAGWFERVEYDGFEQVTGHPTTTFKEFVSAHMDYFS